MTALEVVLALLERASQLCVYLSYIFIDENKHEQLIHTLLYRKSHMDACIKGILFSSYTK